MVSEVQRNEFSQLVEQLAVSDNILYIEALASFVEDNDVDIPTIPKLLSKSLLSKLQQEGIRHNTIAGKKEPSLMAGVFK